MSEDMLHHGSREEWTDGSYRDCNYSVSFTTVRMWDGFGLLRHIGRGHTVHAPYTTIVSSPSFSVGKVSHSPL